MSTKTKLCLGSAQFGLNYGITNTKGKTQSVVSKGVYPNGSDAAFGDVKPLSGLSLCF